MLTFVALASFWAPAMALLSDAAEDAGLDLALAFAISNLAWAVGHVFGARRGRRGRGRDRGRGALRARSRCCARRRWSALTLGRRRQRGAQHLAAAVRPGRGAACAVQLQREPVLEPLGRVGRVAAAAEARQVARLNWYLPR